MLIAHSLLHIEITGISEFGNSKLSDGAAGMIPDSFFLTNFKKSRNA